MEIDLIEDPRKVIEFKPAKREGNLVPVRAKYDACKHERTYVDQGARRVTCQGCSAELDAFTVLLELAHKQRRYLEDLDHWDARRESILSERYDEEWQRDRGVNVISAPPSDPETKRVWDTFHQAIGPSFCGMYKRKQRKINGPQWYGKTITGGMISYEYARSKTIQKLVAGK